MPHPVKTPAYEPQVLTVKSFQVSPRTWYAAGQTQMGYYLVDTGNGLILTGTAIPESVYLLVDPTYRLGYKPEDIKKILLDHAHFDHHGTAKAMKELTGVSVYLPSEGYKFYRKCPKETLVLDPDFHPQDFTVGASYSDEGPVTLGDISTRTVLTPGYTIGCTSFFWEERNPVNGEVYVVATYGGVGASTMNDDYYASSTYLTPDLKTRFLRDAEKLRGIHVDIALLSHPSQIEVVDRVGQYIHEAQPYLDDTVWVEFTEERARQIKELMKQTQGKETMEMYIVLVVTLFMMISFILYRVLSGATTMVCCLILAMTGIVDIQSALSGFGNKIMVLIAPMLALSSVLTKISLVVRISSVMNTIKGRRDMLLVASFSLVGAIFAQFIPTTAAITVLVVFLSTLDNTGDIMAKRVLLPPLGVMVAWKLRFPIGLDASAFAMVDGIYEGIIPDPEFQLTMLDPFIFSIPAMILLTLYYLFFWKLVPRSEEDIDQSELKETKGAEMLSHGQGIPVYTVSVVIMLSTMLNKWTGNMLYLAPGLGILILIYVKILRVGEAVKGMTLDMVWMIAGVLVVADTLGKSEVDGVVGNLILRALGSNPGSLTVMLVLSVATVIMIIFLSNMATQMVLIPIATSVALAGGWDPRGVVLVIGTCNYFALGLPLGSGEMAACSIAGRYNPVKVLKFTFPFMIVAILTCASTTNVMHPIY